MTEPQSDAIVVFAGPSLPAADRPRDPRLVWRPPAVAGDALALLGTRPRAMVLIDGLFDEWPAIRHKELLSLMAEGVAVFGGSSMGALRAAELHTLGMIGVGRIFEAYRRGLIDADDEVAVLHGPAAFDWSPLTEPLVNVRVTLRRAVRQKVVSQAAGRVLLEAARAIYYKNRTWASALAAAGADGAVPGRELEALRAWLPAGYVDQKRRDALACVKAALRHGKVGRAAGPRPPRTFFSDVLAEQVAKGVRRREEYL